VTSGERRGWSKLRWRNRVSETEGKTLQRAADERHLAVILRGTLSRPGESGGS